MRWPGAAEHSSDLGADARKGFILHGQRAGAGIAAGLALMARDERLSPPLTGVSLCVPFTLDPEAVPVRYVDAYRSREECLDAPILHKAALDSFKGERQQCCAGQTLTDKRDTSPT